MCRIQLKQTVVEYCEMKVDGFTGNKMVQIGSRRL